MLRDRDLPESEWGRLDLPHQLPRGSRVIAVEDEEGRIVGYWCVITAVHLEPVWIDPAYRGNASMVRKLWRGVRDVLVDNNVEMAVAVLMRDNPASHVIKRMGFQPVNADLYFAAVNSTVEL